jgi:hypothetical protein
MQSIYRIVAMTTAVLSAVAALAQFQVNTQVVNPGAAGSVRYSNAYGAQPYSGNPYGGQQMLPSETRNAAFQSGATRSEIRMQASAVGPLAPQGTSAYIPPSYEQGKSYRTTPAYSMGSVNNVPSGYSSPPPINPSLTGAPGR